MAFSSDPHRPSVVGWSLLPDVLLEDILSRFHILQDFYAVRAVCRNWRITASPSPFTLLSQHPLLLVSQSLYDVVTRRFYSFRFPFTANSHLTVGYSHAHLITINSRNRLGSNIILWNLFTQAQIHLPVNPYPFKAVRLSARPDSANCLVVLYDKISNRVQYLNVGEATWIVVSSPHLKFFYDMMFFNGELLAVTQDMGVLAAELVGDSLRVRKFGNTELPPRQRCYSDLWLGELYGAVLVVIRYYFRRRGEWCVMFCVFLWSNSENKWEEIHCLGDKTLLVSEGNNVVSISATRLGLRNNCIYDSNYMFGKWSVFSLEDKSTKMVKIDGRDCFAMATTSEWVFPNYC